MDLDPRGPSHVSGSDTKVRLSHLPPVRLVALGVQALVWYEHNSAGRESTYTVIRSYLSDSERSSHIFLISSTGICIQARTSGNSATISLLLIVILATIFLSAVFFAAWFLSFLPLLCNSARSSATLPYARGQLPLSECHCVCRHFALTWRLSNLTGTCRGPNLPLQRASRLPGSTTFCILILQHELVRSPTNDATS